MASYPSGSFAIEAASPNPPSKLSTAVKSASSGCAKSIGLSCHSNIPPLPPLSFLGGVCFLRFLGGVAARANGEYPPTDTLSISTSTLGIYTSSSLTSYLTTGTALRLLILLSNSSFNKSLISFSLSLLFLFLSSSLCSIFINLSSILSLLP